MNKAHTCRALIPEVPLPRDCREYVALPSLNHIPYPGRINPNNPKKSAQNDWGRKKPQRWSSPTSSTMFTPHSLLLQSFLNYTKGKFNNKNFSRLFQTWIFPCKRDLQLTIYPSHPSLFPLPFPFNGLLTLWGFLLPCSLSPFSTMTLCNTMKSGNKI